MILDPLFEGLSINLQPPVQLVKKEMVPVFTPHPTEPDSYVFRIDNSTLTKFQTCPRSAEFYVLYRRTSNTKVALVFGGAVHKGLESLYLHGFNPDGLAIGESRILQHFRDNPVVQDWRTDVHAVTCLRKYYNEYKDDTTIKVLNTPSGEPFIEKSFDVELGHIDVDDELHYPVEKLVGKAIADTLPNKHWLKIRRIYVHFIGRLDLLVQYVDGKKRVADHKTTTMLGDTFFDSFILDQQPTGYVYACEQIFGERPDGFLLNALALRKPTPSGKPFEFHRKYYNYSAAQVEEWRQDFISLTSDFLSHAFRGYFPKSTPWCFGKYGACPYFEVCRLPKEHRLSMLNTSAYMDVTWDPTADQD